MELIDFLRSHGITLYRHGEIKDKHVRRGWVSTHCPICEPPFHGTHLWLGINETSHAFYCWNHGKCNIHQIFRAWNIKENPKEFYQYSNLIAPPGILQSEGNIQEKPKECVIPFRLTRLIDSPPHCQYLEERRLNPSWLADNFGVCALDGRFPFPYQYRIFFPIYNRKGELCTYQMRTIEKNNKYRYLAARPENEKERIKTLLYGEHFCHYYDTVVVVEGLFDALRLWSVGIKSLCVFGKSVTKTQIDQLIPYSRKFLLFDSESETQSQAKKLCHELSLLGGSPCGNIELESSNDPAEASEQELMEIAQYVM